MSFFKRFFKKTPEVKSMAEDNWPRTHEARAQWLRENLPDFADQLLALARPGFSLESASEQDFGVATKIGGRPDLPLDFDWPQWKGTPLNFVAQINLAQLPAQEGVDLPQNGLLSFFYDSEQSTWGSECSDVGSWRVCHFESLSDLAPKELPKEILEHWRIDEKKLVARPETFLPTWDELDVWNIELPLDDEYDELVSGLPSDPEEPLHRLLGCSVPIQNSMQSECQLASNGNAQNKSPEAQELLKGAKDWILLLQIDSDEEVRMMWGDFGRIYFWIREEDLRARRFDKTWFILQCH